MKIRDADIVVDEKEEDLSLICGHKKPPSSSLSNGNSKIKKTFSMRSGSKQGLKTQANKDNREGIIMTSNFSIQTKIKTGRPPSQSYPRRNMFNISTKV